MHGAKLQLMPVARTSSAVIRAAFSIKRRIARTPQADVMREDDRAQHIVMSVHRIDAEENWNSQTSG